MRIRLVLALTVVIVGLAIAFAISRVRDRVPDRLLEQAKLSYGRGDWNQSAESARLVLRARPSETAALRILARSSARVGKDETAEAIYRRLGTGAMEAEDLFLLGRGLLKRDPHGPGLAALGAARDLDPDHPETLNELLGFLIEGQSLLQAAIDAERLSRQPGWEVRGMVLLARVRHKLLEPAAAAELLVDAIRRDPGLAQTQTDPRDVRLLLARCLLETGRPDQARQQLEKVLRSSSDAEAYWLLSRALLMAGRSGEARAALDQSRILGPADPLAAQPAPYLGAARCASCHSREYQSQRRSRHSHSIKIGHDLTSAGVARKIGRRSGQSRRLPYGREGSGQGRGRSQRRRPHFLGGHRVRHGLKSPGPFVPGP